MQEIMNSASGIAQSKAKDYDADSATAMMTAAKQMNLDLFAAR